MQRRNSLAVAMAATVIAGASAGWAQASAPTSSPPASPPPQAASPPAAAPQSDSPEGAPTPERLGLAKRLLDDMGGAANMTNALNTIMSAYVSQVTSQAGLPPAQAEALRQAMTESMAALTPRLLDEVAAVYAQDFDAAQLADIAAFYEGPTGRALVAKLPQITQQSAVVGGRLMPEMQREIIRRFCQKVSCANSPVSKYLPQPD